MKRDRDTDRSSMDPGFLPKKICTDENLKDHDSYTYTRIIQTVQPYVIKRDRDRNTDTDRSRMDPRYTVKNLH